MSRRRRIVSVLLLVLLVVTTVLAIFGLWAKRQLLDEKTWRHTNTALISDPAIQAAVAGYIVDSIYQDGKVASSIEGALPGRLKPLGGPISGALREGLEHAARTALQRPQLQRAWSSVVDLTHRQVIALVEDKHTPLRRLTGKNAILDLRPLIGDVSLRLGLPPSIIDQMPAERVADNFTLSSSRREAATRSLGPDLSRQMNESAYTHRAETPPRYVLDRLPVSYEPSFNF